MELYQDGSFWFYKEKGIVKEMLLTGFDLEGEMKELDTREIRSVWLNRFFCGNRINDLSFLKNHPQITKVCIVDGDFDCSVISGMKQLSYLQIETKTSIDLSQLNNLNTLITNDIGTKGLPPNIQKLHLEDVYFQNGNMKNVCFPTGLKYLEINRTNLTCLYGIPSNLQHLGIYYGRKLMSLDGLDSAMNSIEELEISHCPKLTDYSQLKYCGHLQKIILIKSGNISSLSLLENAKELKHLTLSGTYVTDKNLHYSKTIPYTYITNRKYYEK